MHFCRWKSSSVQQTLQYKYNKKGDFKSIEISFCLLLSGFDKLNHRILYYFAKYSLMPAAAFLPSPMARITVAAPRTMSPPAHTFA